ncbi:MAG: phosphoenolpyruvate carboxylase, partial [Firmicutes bacterium]|nr:phosphoenolpyruvate carboxylase [Bacillota bacterium]
MVEWDRLRSLLPQRTARVLGWLDEVAQEEAGEEAPALAHRWIADAFQARQAGAPMPRPRLPEVSALRKDVIHYLVWTLRLMNVVEDTIRLDRLERRWAEPGSQPARGSLEAYMAEAGPTLPEVFGQLRLVLTAHPTESLRRTLLNHLKDFGTWLLETESRPRSRLRRTLDAAEGRERLRVMWRTRDVRVERPDVQSEVELGLFYLTETLWTQVPRLLSD